MRHSKTLQETSLWKRYEITAGATYDRIAWTKEVCETACAQLKEIVAEFPNFTLHDGVHVLNVLDAMGGLLGKKINQLTVGETELLLLSAALHDIGMVYTAEEKERCFKDSSLCRSFLKEKYPEKLGLCAEDWGDEIRLDYLRWLHPIRVKEVLEQPEWKEIFDRKPNIVATRECIVAVCQAHGETPETLRRRAADADGALRYHKHREVDPLFCAILLRLADILDFDDSRAPKILLSYVGDSKKSQEEWKKHQASMGFNYPPAPEKADLPFGAVCTNPAVARSLFTFLDWVDTELANSRGLQELCSDRWKKFPLPFQVDRGEIEHRGYDYGDFQLTMDQTQILKLLTGENLYKEPTVFVRELLQNAIDATTLRAKMDPGFSDKLNTDEARIDLWEWYDAEGELWFRIDDNGTGMTRGMMERYFLKAGSSYYNSKELERDLGNSSFTGISQFGIGFLSCFLCGTEARVATTYWNPEKNRTEAGETPEDRKAYGLRMDVTGLTGYYTLWNQAISDNEPQPLLMPPAGKPRPSAALEQNGYRTRPGTSIAIRIAPGKLGLHSLRMAAEKWLCFPMMPVYYNGERLGMTRDALMAVMRENEGVTIHELTDEEKAIWDQILPELQGEYPVVREIIEIFEGSLVPGLPAVSILYGGLWVDGKEDIFIGNKGRIHINSYLHSGYNALRFLDVWSAGIYEPIVDTDRPDPGQILLRHTFQAERMDQIREALPKLLFTYAYHGIASDDGKSQKDDKLFYDPKYSFDGLDGFLLLLDEDANRPIMTVDREHIQSLSLRTSLFLSLWILSRPTYIRVKSDLIKQLKSFKASFGAFKKLLSNDFSKWALPQMTSLRESIIDGLTSGDPGKWYPISRRDLLQNYAIADLQLRCRMTVDYENGQVIELGDPDPESDEGRFDLLPPMPFCWAKTEKDRKRLCCAEWQRRICVTADHPFTVWLLDNAAVLKLRYPQQFELIVIALKAFDIKDFITVVENIITKIRPSAHRFGIDVNACPKLTEADFWTDDRILSKGN